MIFTYPIPKFLPSSTSLSATKPEDVLAQYMKAKDDESDVDDSDVIPSAPGAPEIAQN